MSNLPSVLHETCNSTNLISLDTALFRERKIFLTDPLDTDTCAVLLKQLLCLESADGGKEITLYINSPGGEVLPTLAVYHHLRGSKCPVRTVIIGRAASAAAILFLAGDKREMYRNTEFMVHSAMNAQAGYENPFEARDRLERLLETNEVICRIISERTGKPEDTVREWLKKDTFFKPGEALEAGAATAVIDSTGSDEKAEGGAL